MSLATMWVQSHGECATHPLRPRPWLSVADYTWFPRGSPCVLGGGLAPVVTRCPRLFLPGVDLISACDIRYCAQDAFFQVKVSRFPRALG